MRTSLRLALVSGCVLVLAASAHAWGYKHHVATVGAAPVYAAAPVYSAPVYHMAAPVYSAPVYSAPVYSAPAAPVYYAQAAPTYAAPTYAAPTYASPTYAAPTYAAPAYAPSGGCYGSAAPAYAPSGGCYGSAAPAYGAAAAPGLGLDPLTAIFNALDLVDKLERRIHDRSSGGTTTGTGSAGKTGPVDSTKLKDLENKVLSLSKEVKGIKDRIEGEDGIEAKLASIDAKLASQGKKIQKLLDQLDPEKKIPKDKSDK